MMLSYFKARYPIIYIVTAEESRAELEIAKCAQELKWDIRSWSHTEGFIDPSNPKDREQVDDPIEALTYARENFNDKNGPGVIFIFKDIHPFFNAPKVVRLLRDIARDFKQQQKSLVIISPVNAMPPELERDAVLIEYNLPARDEIGVIFDTLYKSNKKAFGEVSEDDREQILQASMGLTTVEAEGAFAKAVIDRAMIKKDAPAISTLVMREKAQAVKKSGILEYFDASENLNDIGGLDNLKEWLSIRKQAYTKRARDFGLPMPRGIVLVGLPGCGKSLSAKATASVLGVPLIRFDIGRVFGGLVGQSESNMRKAIQTIEAIGNAVVWIDEMEKAFAGMGGSGGSDSGVSQRVFGSFITWMQEKKVQGSFIVATVNRIDGLPPELLRKGRFDEIFYVGLPTPKEREEILKIHVKKRGRDVSKYDFTDCVRKAEGFSGAELEEAVTSGMYTAFYLDKELDDLHILGAIMKTVPLSKSKADQLNAMAKWAKINAIAATKDTEKQNARELLVEEKS